MKIPMKQSSPPKILGIHENKVILDRTLFYPEGGGQPSDLGFLEIDNEKIRVLHAEKLDNIVLHKIDEKSIDKLKSELGSTVKGQIDWDRRVALARNHSATHLIVSAARNVLGDHIWQAGAQKGLKKSRIDLSHYQRIKSEEIREIEHKANDFVRKNLPIATAWMDRREAEKKYGFTLYQGGVVPGSRIRVIKIKQADVQACAGTHVDRTGDIGLIKINRTERIQDGVERLEFSAGEAAIEALQKNEALLEDGAKIFKVKKEQLPPTCQRFFSEWKAFKNEIKRLQKGMASLKLEGLREKSERMGDLTVLRQRIDADRGEMSKIVTDFIEDPSGVDLVLLVNSKVEMVGGASEKALRKGIKMNEIIQEVAMIMGGGGGGKPQLAQGKGKSRDKLPEAFNYVLDYLKKERDVDMDQKRKSEDIDYWKKTADKFFEEGKYLEALEAYETLAKIEPKNAEAWKGMGASFSLLGKSYEALESLEKAIKIDKYDSEALEIKKFVLENLLKENEKELSRIKDSQVIK